MKSACTAMAFVGACAAGAPAEAQTRPAVEIRVMSTRADTVSGGDVLVQVTFPRDVAADAISVALNGQDVTSSFRPARQGTALLGLVSGLRLGPNQLEAESRGEVRRRSRARLSLVNRPVTGPVISGPHQKPFNCETVAFGLGPALDADCSATTRVDYFYRSTATNSFKPLDPAASRPADLARTTTSEGQTVPYIARREMGTINRAVYVIGFLHEPGTPLPDPWAPSPGWNGRLVYSFGGGCRAGYHQGRTAGGLTVSAHHLEESQLGDYALAKGYAIAAASLNVLGTTCDDVISAETTMMVKEHFIEQFGMPRYTIGSGRSGGAMQQHMIANNYPGLLDGIIPTASFPDNLITIVAFPDCDLLERAFNTSALPWTAEQKTAVSGRTTYGFCSSAMRFGNLRPGNCDPDAVPADQHYNAATSPRGARCTYHDNMVNVFGRDPKTGFARRPFDNVGVQYGLRAFNAGQISVEQFLDLNTRIGGQDLEGRIVADRMVADPDALRILYRTGRLNDGSRGMAASPVIDVRPYVDPNPDVHDSVNSYIMRARLIAANGHADNQILLTYATGTPIVPVQQGVLDVMDRWLSNISHDSAPGDAAAKVVRNKPRELVHACFTAEREKITDLARCGELFPYAAGSRIAAGAPMTDDVLKCELKPIAREDHARPLTAGQLASLHAIFPRGVCDYSRKGVGQSAPDAWLAYPRPGERLRLEPSSN